MKTLPLLITVLLILLALSVSIAARDQQQISIEACNTQYHNNAFEDAIACYQNIPSEGHSANILYNIGNSYAQLDQPGYSVLYFLRALSINPGDSDISGNLAMVKKEKGLFPPEKSAAQLFFSLLSLGQWSLLCLLSVAGYLIFSCTRLTKGKNVLLESFVILLCVFSLSAGVLGTIIRYREWHQSVVIKDSRLLVSPFENGASIGSIEQGRLVYPHKEHGNYWYVTDETGRKGWLETEVFESIMPQ
jgi:hypothetical protein